jgi:predicted nucleic acid-binding protein
MTKTIYLDTNVYLDYYFDRRGSETAFRILFFRTPRCEFKIVVSDWVLKELELNGVDSKKVNTLFDWIAKAGKLIKVFKTAEDIEVAKKISEHFQDPLHAVLARKGGSGVVVTSDKYGFNCCRHLVDTKFPEEI